MKVNRVFVIRNQFKTSTIKLLAFFLSVSFLGHCKNDHPADNGEEGARGTLSLEVIAEDLKAPVALVSSKDGTGRLFVVDQTGYINIIKNGKLQKDEFLNIGDKLSSTPFYYTEKGLLDIEFYPGFKQNGRFFVYYSAPTGQSGYNHQSILAEYRVSSADKDRADPNSEKVILTVQQPESNHNGGELAFGPDGYLYVGLGDGGGAGDKHGQAGNGQNKETLLGSIIRIDVDSRDPYAIPRDNPFVDKPGKDEIFAYGLRNPWRFSFGPGGRLFCGDVGQNTYEEIDIIEKGKNYGWRIMEGNHCYNPSENCDRSGLEMPIYEYDHNTGISVTGGFVYQGNVINWMKGMYVFADWNGKMFALEETADRWEDIPIEVKGNVDYGHINSFGENANGELYILTRGSSGLTGSTGAIYRLKP